ncbi:hypothetical protein FDUTEX481_09511 [Tolypothrix sp. PCC 7601]|nr:hypothetical protein FDUTEX481_09511 [Tolypothrix sp. PCC 7601]
MESASIPTDSQETRDNGKIKQLSRDLFSIFSIGNYMKSPH